MEEHPGSWQECVACRNELQTEMYVYYGTNEYNFEKMKNPPEYEPTHCATCGAVINLGEDGYSERGDEYWCQSCSEKELRRVLGELPGSGPGSGNQQSGSRIAAVTKKRTGRRGRPRS